MQYGLKPRASKIKGGKMVAKRDRWGSSSDEEDEPKKKIPVDEEKTSTPADMEEVLQINTEEINQKENENLRDLREHNPLLQGCRFVHDCFERLSHIDEGTYGVVWKARDLATQEIVALKQIKFDPELCKEGFPMAALREINVLMALSHENIVTVREMCVGKGHDKVYMVMEW